MAASSSNAPHHSPFGPLVADKLTRDNFVLWKAQFLPGVPESDTPPAPVSSPETQRPRTPLQSGIVKPKQFTDGTFRYGHLCSTGEPQSVQEALGDPKWKKAMEEEYAALLKNGTWHLVPYRSGMNLIDCKWVFKIRVKEMGRLIHTKVVW
jgi:hypothetical protein